MFPVAREAFVLKKEREAQERRARKRQAQRQSSQAQAQRRSKLITLQTPKVIRAGSPVTVKLRHRLDAELGTQRVHVTLKAGANAKRVERKVIKVQGRGEAKVTFDVPADTNTDALIIAAFVGKDFQTNLQHVNSKPIPVK